MDNENINLFDATLNCLDLRSPYEKIQCVRDLNGKWLAGRLGMSSSIKAKRIDTPGRPELPKLINPREVPRRGFNSEAARLKLVHAITHIEFNAINLTLDAVY